jgi:type I restriction enzyme S subunit
MIFERTILKNLALNITDGEHASVIDDPNGDYFLLSNKNIVDGYIKYDQDLDRKISKSTFDKISKRTKLAKNDVLISTVGSIGKLTIIRDQLFNYTFQRSVGIIKCDTTKLLPEYLYYYLKQNLVQKRLINVSKGAVQKCLFINDLDNFLIDFPISLDDQQKIASILSTLDAKIELNNRINAKLEEMAKTLYDYWFVQFDFPNSDGKPYKASGGKMVWNKELKREIPDGWEVKSLTDLLKKNTDHFDYTSNKSTIDLSVMPSNSISLSTLNISSNFTTNLFNMKKGDILFGAIRPYLHKAGIAPCDGVVTGTVHSYNTINEFDYNFALITMTRNTFFDYAENISTGTKMPVVSSEILLKYKLPYEAKIVQKFNELCLRDSIPRNILENQKLTEIRDTLLPLLMNGQVKVD